MDNIYHIPCPVCSNKRLIDVYKWCRAETKPKDSIPQNWKPDFAQKCRICKREIAIRKVS